MTEPTTSAPGKVRPPLARDVVKAVAVEHGVCIRPVAMRRTDLATGQTEIVNLPCGHTLASVCPPCAERKRKIRATQCREGWHLEEEPVIIRADPDVEQRVVDGEARRGPGPGRTRRTRRRRRDRTAGAADRDQRRDHPDRRRREAPDREAGTSQEVHQTSPRRPGPPTASRHVPDRREGLHGAGRQDVPARPCS